MTRTGGLGGHIVRVGTPHGNAKENSRGAPCGCHLQSACLLAVAHVTGAGGTGGGVVALQAVFASRASSEAPTATYSGPRSAIVECSNVKNSVAGLMADAVHFKPLPNAKASCVAMAQPQEGLNGRQPSGNRPAAADQIARPGRYIRQTPDRLTRRR